MTEDENEIVPPEEYPAPAYEQFLGMKLLFDEKSSLFPVEVIEVKHDKQ